MAGEARRFERQLPNQVVDVAEWHRDDRYIIHPVGAREKSVVHCPDPAPFPFLIPEHRYLFKRPLGRFRRQAWTEPLAYELGLAGGVVVPPAFLAVDSKREEVGALIEFFHGFPNGESETLVHAADQLEGTITDKERGRPHSLKTNIELCRRLRLPDPVFWWARTLTFDALIGNVDRHPTNWGYLEVVRGRSITRDFSPVFDNGTSLGYELEDEALQGWDDARWARYVKNGRHHLTVEVETGSKGGRHLEVCTDVARTYRAALPSMRDVVAFEQDYVDGLVDWARSFDFPVEVSAIRGAFLSKLIGFRALALREIVEAAGG